MSNTDNSIFMARNSAFSPYRLIRRETGFGVPIGAGDAMAKSLYCGMKPLASWDCEQANALPTGGVFNLEFSPEGSLLVAACEKKSIQIFDPLTHQRIHSVHGAHSDCVNCVKFLDGRMFATCSDDTTIALWDVRNLKKKIRSLLGHSNWVKNIEFSVKDKLLVTSGLDGSIYTWDINSYTEFNLVYQRVFHASGLMRCRLSPDARQMVMCTTGGLLVIVHDLNLATLAQDLHGFKPNLYRLMQMSQQLIPIAAMYDHLFDSKRKENRVEFVTDFPEGNDAQVVSALQIHPQGWSALTRNISHDDRSEWSCIHDIQPMEEPSDKSVRDAVCLRRPPRAPRRRLRPYRPHHRHLALAALQAAAATPGAAAALGPLPIPLRPAMAGETPSTSHRHTEREEDRDSDSESGRSRLRTEPSTSGSSGASGTSAASEASGSARRAGGLSSIQNDVWEASITIKQHRMLQELYSRGQVGRNFNMQRIMGINTGIAPPHPRPDRAAQPQPHSSSSLPSTSGSSREGCISCGEEDTRHFIRQNRDRLLYYIEETNEGKGFIKELCFSSDGRLVCSPFGRGMRLLALTESCSELNACVPHEGPLRMQEIGSCTGIHGDLVVSSKFSPRHHLLVTGCLEGRIVWYEPYSGETFR